MDMRKSQGRAVKVILGFESKDKSEGSMGGVSALEARQDTKVYTPSIGRD